MRCGCIAALEHQRSAEVGFGGDGVFEADDGLEVRYSALALSAAAERAASRVSPSTHAMGLAVEHHDLGEERLVMAVRAGIAFARDVGGGQHGGDARLRCRGGNVDRDDTRVGVRREYGESVQEIRKARLQDRRCRAPLR